MIVVGLNYSPGTNPLKFNTKKSAANISVYAQNYDYHDIIKEKLINIQDWLISEFNISSKVFVDTSPVMEKYFAQKQKLAGKVNIQTLSLKNLDLGCFLAEIFLPIKIKEEDNLIDNCGTCTKCIDICPTDAILEDNIIDARKCISYLTIEYRGPIPKSLRKKWEIKFMVVMIVYLCAHGINFLKKLMKKIY